MAKEAGEDCCPGCSPEMGRDPSAQVLELLAFLLLGTGIGLLYDLLRPLRRRSSGGGGALLDLAFAMMAAAAAFLGAMGAENGRLGLWELMAVLLGFLLYLYGLSPALLPLLDKGYRLIFRTIRLFKKFEKNLGKTAKKIFPNLQDWIIMKR